MNLMPDVYAADRNDPAARLSEAEAADINPKIKPAGPGLYRRRPSTYVIRALLLLIFGILIFVYISMVQAKPADLGTSYSKSDYNSALAKTGITLIFPGMDEAEKEEFLAANENRKLKLTDYEITYSGYAPRSFELTPTEATALLNEFLPMFSLFSDVQLAVPANGRFAASSRIHVEKMRLEILPDVIGSTQPEFLNRLLPQNLNIEVEGPAFRIENNTLIQPAQLTRIKTGAVSLRPFIGNTDQPLRDAYTSYIERIYRRIPQMQIRSLRINSRRNFEFRGVIPTRITIQENQANEN